MSQLMLRFYMIAVIVLAGAVRSYCQNAIPEELKQGTISEQLKYLNERTRVYENYRAIREDMFQITSRNVMDTLTKAKSRINELVRQTKTLNSRIDSINKSMEATNNKLMKATRTKDSISILGMEVNKLTYNSIMWTMLAAALFLLIVGFLTFRRNSVITIRTKKDLDDLKEEFEAYRQKTRIEREKTNLEHFNEIKKLKGGGSNRG
jgi:outer membrane murein-binding lipoprotein Lpp